jgi:hypothetical protein
MVIAVLVTSVGMAIALYLEHPALGGVVVGPR